MWNTLIFGKSVEQMIEEGIQSRLSSIGEESSIEAAGYNETDCKRVEGPNYLHYPVTVIQAEKKEGFAKMCTAAQAKEVVSDRRRHQNVPGYIPFTGVLSSPLSAELQGWIANVRFTFS